MLHFPKSSSDVEDRNIKSLLGKPRPSEIVMCVFPQERDHSLKIYPRSSWPRKKTKHNRKCSCFLIYSLRLIFVYTVNTYFLTVIKALDMVMNQTWSPFSTSPSGVCTQSYDGPLVVMNLQAALATPACGISFFLSSPSVRVTKVSTLLVLN